MRHGLIQAVICYHISYASENLFIAVNPPSNKRQH